MPATDDLKNVCDMLKESLRGDFSESAFSLWFAELKLTELTDNKAVFTINNEMRCGIINNKYLSVISDHLSGILDFKVKTEVRYVPDDGTVASSEKESVPSENKAVSPPPNLNQSTEDIANTQSIDYNFEYTFDNFIIGNSNRFAHAACIAVANNLAYAYNPLFIYGPSGIGKTHLMYALQNEIRRKNPSVNMIYIKGEDFTNQLIDSLAKQKPALFREKYRKCDVLLIDDIQFISGKVSTQEEFFHTFNALYEDHKQIILTSDRPPVEIKPLEDRLRTRFESGLIADIQPPDLELRNAIIKKKAESVGIEIPPDALAYLADNLKSNIRQIEGAIKKLGALSFLSGTPVTLETAKSAVAELLGGSEPTSVTIEKIFAVVTSRYDIPKEDLLGTRRTKEIANARHIAIYIIRTMTDMSLPNIGKTFSRDHTTILSSCDLIASRIREDKAFEAEINDMIKEVKSK